MKRIKLKPETLDAQCLNKQGASQSTNQRTNASLLGYMGRSKQAAILSTNSRKRKFSLTFFRYARDRRVLGGLPGRPGALPNEHQSIRKPQLCPGQTLNLDRALTH